MRRRLLSALVVLGFVPIAAALPAATPVGAVSAGIVISQVYGGGGNTGATYTNDFIELFNLGDTAVDVTGWSVQYASSSGTTWQATQLVGTIDPGKHFLVQQAAGTGGTTPLPTPEATGTIAMSGTNGKVALVNLPTPLSGACPTAGVVDLVGYGSANCFEGTGAVGVLSNTTSAARSDLCVDTDDNAADFATGAPTPRNSASAAAPCAPVGPIDPVINEFSASTVGTDVEFVEVFGSPSADYAAYTLLEIEGDVSGTATGTVDEVIAIGATDAAGLYVANLAANTLENGSLTFLLVEGFTGAPNDDLDTNDDGTLDVTPWSGVVDAVAVADGGAGDLTYGTPVLGAGYDGAAFAPGGASRIPDGTDTDTTADWVRNDFDLAGIPGFIGTPVVGEALNTPGASNVAVTASTATVTIASTDAAAAEAGPDTATFTVSRTGDTTAALDVAIAVSGDAAPADYTPALGSTVTIPAGQPSVDVVITPVDDTDAESLESLVVTVTAGAGYVVGAASSITITIADDDATGPIITPIHAIQGSGPTSVGGTFTIEGVVTGDYQTQGTGQLRGFFVQEEDTDADADPATSEGIFVFCSTCPTAVAVGDVVQVTGLSSEFFNMSQLTASAAGSVSVLSTGATLPTATALELPVPGVPSGDLVAATAAINAYYERTEGMRVSFPDTLTVTEYFELARFGQVILTEGERPRTFTDANVPSAAGLVDHQIDLARRSVILDDGDNQQNRPVATPNTAYPHPAPGLSTTNRFRGGDAVTGLTGVLHWSFNGQTGEDAWRIRPEAYTVTPVNLRAPVPEVGGRLTVASFNVLNYFLTVDTTASNDVGTCGPTGVADCRGADSAQELERQRTKMLAALAEIDADVFGFMEMENTPGVEPLADIVAGLPGYDYVDTGVIGGDAIRVGIIYKTSAVTPIGAYALLDESVDPRFDTSRSRPALAQTFEENATGARFTVVVNHLKSKGSGCGVGDDDTTTGQGNCNGTRTRAAQALADWTAADPTGTGEDDVLIIGDLNSYAKEDPITALVSAGYTDLVRQFGGDDAYGYVFDGQVGYLDHALGNASLTPQVSGVAEWHVNADEIPLFDYNDDVRDAGEASFEEESDVLPLYLPDAYRTSDHDPVIIGLALNAAPAVTATPATQSVQYSDPIAAVTVTASDVAADLPLSLATEWSVDGGVVSPGLPAGLSLAAGPCGSGTCSWTISGTADVAPGDYTIAGVVNDGSGDTTGFTVTVTVGTEDARITFTGPRTVATTGTTSTAATVTLAATVRDISATPDAGGDVAAGDIRTARVTFVNRAAGNAPIPGCTDLVVGLSDADDERVGTVACQWPVTITGTSRTFTVGVVVDGYYARDAATDDVTITVRRPVASHSASGTAVLRLTGSAGALAGDDGALSAVTFNGSFVRGGRTLQGSATVLVPRTEDDGSVHVYRISTTSVTALTVFSGPRTATLDGVATITDVTNPAAPVTVATGALFELTMDDNGNRGTTDTLGITVWNPAGGLWFASRTDGVQTVQQRLASGNLTVR